MNKLRWLFAAVFAVAGAVAPLAAQARGTVTGRVVDAASQRPVAGANVRVAGTPVGTQSDEEGRFTLRNVPQGARTIQATRIGYQQGTASANVGTGTVDVTLRLAADPLGLEGIVAIGYGEQSRRNVTGAVASVRAEEVQNLPTPSIENALQGRVAGVQVVQNSGAPGAAPSIRIRGSSSISAGNQPLYVIDGVPLVQGNFSALNGTYGGQDVDALSDINPNEIESIEVLKDASAAAIYGSRASNGVVLITTRRGRAGRADIRFSTQYGTQSAWRKLGFLDTEQYIQIYNEGLTNRFGPDFATYLGYNDDNVENDVEVVRGTNTDWVGAVMRDAPLSNFNGSIAGGTERSRYFVSGSAFTQDGIVRGYGYERLNGRLNLDYAPTERLTLGTNVGLVRSVTERTRGDNTLYGPFANAIASPPVEAIYNEDGTYNIETTYANAVGIARENEGEERGVHILGNTFAQYRLATGLNARVSLGLDQFSLRSRLYDSPLVGLAVGSNGAGSSGNSYITKLQYEATVNFNRALGERNELSGVVGVSREDNSLQQNVVEGTQFPTSAFRYLGSAATISSGTDSLTESSLQSAFGRLTHTFADRLTTTANVRLDGSSRFGEDNRYGLFPSLSVLYRVGDAGLLGNLAFRGSYGRTGNQLGIGDFASQSLYGSGYNYADLPGIAPSQLGNPGLRWETTDQFDVGADFTVFGDRLALTVDYYRKDTDDLLVALPIPTASGFGSVYTNVGSIRNTGAELAARAQLVQGTGRAFNWSVDLNVSRNKNEVTSLLNDQPFPGNFASWVRVGEPLGVFYGYKTEGLFQDANEICTRAGQCDGKHAFQNARTSRGDVRFVDVNEDGVINDDDRTVIGSPWPDFEGGITNRITFAGLDLSAFLQFSRGNEIFNGTRTYTDLYGSGFDNHTERALDRWTPENTDTDEPRAVWGDPNRNTRTSDRFLEDGSYMRLKNATLGYTLPTRFTNRARLGSARVYVQGQNLVTWTKYSGFDPEVNYLGESAVTRGTDFYTLPLSRVITTGIELGF